MSSNLLMPTIFSRYEEIIPELESFYSCISKPLPKTFWFNPLKVDRIQFLKFLAEEHILIECLKWHPYGMKLKSQQALGSSWLYLAGLLQLQEEVSMLPVTILDPKPHEKILDLCAAPGNKTAEIAVRMQNQGTLIANDRNAKRIKALGQITKRLGIVNTSVTLYDGCNFPNIGEFFDKILVDAPCTCEGTIRKNPSKLFRNSKEQSLKKSLVQYSLLEKAFHLLKPGGQLIYSTCTFAPEENEAVVNQILKAYPNYLELLPIKVKHFNFSPGLTSWDGAIYSEELKKSIRVWPHQNDTGGFFIALLEKKKTCTFTKKTDVIKIINNNQAQTLLNDNLSNNFEIDTLKLEKLSFLHSSKRGIYMINKEHTVPSELKIDVMGILAMKTNLKYPKPSTSLISMLPKTAKKNFLQLNNEQLQNYIRKQIIVFENKSAITTGYVIICYQSLNIGLGFAFEREGQWWLQSLFPKWGHA